MTPHCTAFVMTHEAGLNPRPSGKTVSIISLALQRALGREGIRVVRVHPNLMDHSLSSRYCTATEVCPNLYESERALVDFLTEMAERYPGTRVLFPASDDCAAFLATHQTELLPYYRIVVAPPPAMARLVNKREQYALARDADVPIPETYFPTNRSEAEALAPTLRNFPYVIKPLVAQRWRLEKFSRMSRSKKAFLVATPAEFLEEYDRIAAVDPELMLQEVVGGRDDRLYTLLCYCAAGGRPLTQCIRKKIRQSPIDFGYCTLTVSCHDEVVERQARRLMETLGYEGIAGIEFKHDPRTGEYKLIEINARPVNTIALSYACGANVPLAAFLDQIGEPPLAATGWKDGVKWIWFDQDFWVAKELWATGRLTLGEWLRSLLGVRACAIFAIDDPRPSLEYGSQQLRAHLGTALNRFRSRAQLGSLLNRFRTRPSSAVG